MSILKPLIVIIGPTSSGKTDLSLRLARQYNGEIVNADSRQIYEEMAIGTGSPIPLDYKRKDKIYLINNIPHHLFNTKKPNQKFSLSQYKKLALKTIKEIQKRDKLPILVGGTGLYINAIIDNLNIPKAPPNQKIRKRLEKHTEKYLFKKLEKVDLKSAKVIGPQNKRKLIRALEVYEITGKPFSVQQIKGKQLFNTLQIGIKINREKLYNKIDERVDEMIKIGLIRETKQLSQKYNSNLPAMSGIGYFEISSYLKNEMELEEAIQKIKFRTHQYARRQITWFKRNEKIKWVEKYQDASEIINKFLETY